MAKPINDMIINRRKETRGEILMVLDQNRGIETPIKVGWIESALRTRPELAAEVAAQIPYLKGKGYIEVVEQDETPELKPVRSAYIRLTPAGQDVVEGTVEDPGIIFGDADRN